MVEGLTFLINSSNFADDIVLYCVCIRPWVGDKEIGGWAEKGLKGPSRSRALALEDFGRIRYPESHRSRVHNTCDLQ